jgi:hypothetical protein
VNDPLTEQLLREVSLIPQADCVRMCFDWGQDLSRLEGQILFEEIDRLRRDRATLEKMCRYFAAKFRGQDGIPGKVAKAFFERFGDPAPWPPFVSDPPRPG